MHKLLLTKSKQLLYVALPIAVLFIVYFSFNKSSTQTIKAKPNYQNVTIISKDKEHEFLVEIANTPAKREQGLMYRRELAESHGMLFIFDDEEILKFWMKNTYIPLDIIFINKLGKIVKIQEDTTPLSKEVISSQTPAQIVLEVNSGLTRKLSIQEGDFVIYPGLNK